ncbi:MAG: polyphosphate kinase 1 [Gammaproteobacteria bacterium]|nr:MAG: polyphosphate kinase 1 [Gammaproteobacteria bacterium]
MNELDQPELYLNRELSLLEFDRRVLELAADPAVPLLERLRFLCISSSNLDEFFEIRVSGLKQQAAFGVEQPGPDGQSAQETLKRIAQGAHALVAEQYRLLNETLIPELRQQGISFVRRTHWNEKQAEWVKHYFHHELQPVLTPMSLDPAHPFPRVLNKSLNFIVSLTGKDAFGRNSGVAVVQAPRLLPRLVPLPRALSQGAYDFVFLSSIIHAHVGDLFPGMQVTGCFQFRLTRNSELFVNEEEVDDLLRALEGELLMRRYGEAVRLELADNCTPEMTQYLLDQFGLTPDDLYQMPGPVNLHRLLAVYEMVERPDLKYRPFTPGLPKPLSLNCDMFEAMKSGDVLLHHPFESFTPVVDFLRQAASDPQVLAIKQTLYRAGTDSPLVELLVEAARAGKEVTVVVELRARFDEAANIALANRLTDAGAHVLYGVVGYKTHAKMLLVVRREGRRLQRYVHLGTGNYHPGTARGYSDYSLLTCDKEITEDAHKLFQQLTGLGREIKLKKLLHSPFTLHKTLLRLIAREAEHVKQGLPARIIAKMNALSEPQIIRALYEASRAGVKIDLIVRGVCCLRPGVAGVSENIQVRSVMGRFLEHSRVYYFHNAGDPLMYCASADWMNRNLLRRVETCFPVEDPALRARIFEQGLLPYLEDNTQTWLLQSDGGYKRIKPGNQKPRAAQQWLLEKLAGDNAAGGVN